MVQQVEHDLRVCIDKLEGKVVASHQTLRHEEVRRDTGIFGRRIVAVEASKIATVKEKGGASEPIPGSRGSGDLVAASPTVETKQGADRLEGVEPRRRLTSAEDPGCQNAPEKQEESKGKAVSSYKGRHEPVSSQSVIRHPLRVQKEAPKSARANPVCTLMKGVDYTGAGARFRDQGAELFSKPTLTVHPSTTLWEGDTVTLKCQSESQLQEIQLTYKFYKDEESVSQGASESEFRIPSAQPETSGSYWCEVEAEGKKTEKKSSERVQVTVRELFTKPTLTIHPSTTLWQEDNVTLRCQSESRFQGTPLTYKFYRDEEPVSQGLSESEFTIPSARPEMSGSYWCEVEEEGKKTEKKTSERVQVTVRESSPVMISFILRASLFLLMLLPVLVIYQMTEGFPCIDCKKARKEQKGMYVNAPSGGTVQMEASNEGEYCTTSDNDGRYNNI
ncbi:Fc receptor-like protein 3 [Polypterus senegalus]|uniref:Fc receptor-like protein 3 n=1 Tax=Polypterus senegalus TaxID=55291 RepID=UPI001964410F|nr:Fc receptor-like protein 3 [Polypterus senegalus]